MQQITKEQLQKLHVMLNQMGLIDDKPNLVYSYSKGRTTSSRELTMIEARDLIKHLSENDPCQRMRKKIFALAYEANMIWDDIPEDKKMNAIKLDQFILLRGAVRKSLNKMNNKELVKVVSQFEQIVKHKQQTKANKATKSLLDELSIPIEKTRAV